MSSGAIAIAPAAVAVAAAAAVVVVVVAAAAVAAAVIVVRAANAAVEGGVRAIGRYGEKLERELAGLREAEANALRWQCAAGDVVGLNARISLLRERAKAAKVPLDIPPPLDLTGRSLDDLKRWTGSVQRRLCDAQATLDRHLARHELMALPQASMKDNGVATAVAGYQEALRRRYAVAVDEALASVTTDEVEQALAKLDADANEQDRREVLELAAQVAANRDAHAYLSTLRRRILTEINPRVARRRLAAEWLHALQERPVAAALGAGDPPTPLIGTAERLREVVSGAADLTPQLRSEGKALLAWAQDVVQQRFIRQMVQDSLTAQGYSVEGEFNGDSFVGMRLGRADWAGEHTADVWVDQTGKVHGRMVREIGAAGDDAELRDRSRCDSFHDSLAKVAHQMTTVDAPAQISVDPQHKPQQRTSDSFVVETITKAGPTHRKK